MNEQLLALQEADTAVRQLNHRREHLSEREELISVETDLSKVEVLTNAIESERAPHVRDQKRIDDEIAVLAEKSAKDNKALYSGAITDSKELQNLQKEIDSLTQRNGDLENKLLEVMLVLEVSDGQLFEVGAKRSELEGRSTELRAAIELAESEIDIDIQNEKAGIESLRSTLNEEMIARYDKVMAKSGGLAIVTLIDGNTCSGCRRPLPSVEVDGLRRAVDLHPCPHCKRLLVPGV